jgi:hypothetical protein
MVKKRMIVCMSICLMVAMTIMPAYAATGGNSDVGLMSMYYRSANAQIVISSSGTATVTGSITGVIGTTTKTTVHLYLQQYKNDEWVDVDDWLDSGESASRTLVKQKSVEKGYKYRAKASCYAYSSTKSEHVTKYSAEVSY